MYKLLFRFTPLKEALQELEPTAWKTHTADTNIKYCKSGSLVCIEWMFGANQIPTRNIVTKGQLPEGYRPGQLIRIVGVIGNYGEYTANMDIDANGNISIYNPQASNLAGFAGCGCFIAHS